MIERRVLADHTLAALEQACRDLRAAGAPDWASIRVRTTLTVSSDGGLGKGIAARWDDRATDITPAPSPNARPLHGGTWGVAPGPQEP